LSFDDRDFLLDYFFEVPMKITDIFVF